MISTLIAGYFFISLVDFLASFDIAGSICPINECDFEPKDSGSIFCARDLQGAGEKWGSLIGDRFLSCEV